MRNSLSQVTSLILEIFVLTCETTTCVLTYRGVQCIENFFETKCYLFPTVPLKIFIRILSNWIEGTVEQDSFQQAELLGRWKRTLLGHNCGTSNIRI